MVLNVTETVRLIRDGEKWEGFMEVGERETDDDDCFYIAEFSTLEQTHCARV